MKLLLITLTILQSMLTAIEQKTLQSEFTLTQSESMSATSSPISYTGELNMHDMKFTLSMFNIEAAYDGKTLYVYSEDTEELTLSQPTEEELLQTNPFFYAKALLPLCEYNEKVVGENTHITLTPKDKSLGIAKFTLKISTSTLIPALVEIYETDGKQTTLRFNNATYKNECPNFIIHKPDAFINDLR